MLNQIFVYSAISFLWAKNKQEAIVRPHSIILSVSDDEILAGIYTEPSTHGDIKWTLHTSFKSSWNIE